LNSFALTTDGRPVAELERSLKKYLPGLDVRLAQYSPRQAILPGHLMRALNLDYDDAAALLQGLGVERAMALQDDEVVAVLRARDAQDLAPRPTPALKTASGLDWHLTLCRIDEAWTLVGGAGNIDWTGVSVGQIDTGYTTHPAYGFPSAWLRTQLAETFVPDPSIDDQNRPLEAELGKGLDNLVGFSAGHGTKTGCTAAGMASKEAFFGAAPMVPFVPVRICDMVVINDRQRQFEMAVRHLVDVAKVNVINVSLGLVPATTMQEMKRAVDYAYDQGVIVVCAAGNYVRSVVSPARLRRTLAIGGVTVADVPWSGSSYGPEVDLSAPAADVRRAVTSKNSTYSYSRGGDGTSYATAIVTGAAALWLAHHRGQLAVRYAQPWQIVEAFKLAAKTTARKPANWQTGAFGEGVLDARALLDFPLPDASLLVKEAQNA
jgi:subtilisin family serine protease